MMFFEDCERINKFYVEGAATISYRSARPKVSSKIKHFIDIIKSHGNYDLKYDIDGTMLECVDLDNQNKTIIQYNERKQPIGFNTYLINSKYIYASTSLEYDNKDRIIHEIHHSRDFEDENSYSERIYKYVGNKEIFIIPADSQNIDKNTLISIYNNKKQIIEAKAYINDKELMFWDKYEYNKLGQLIKEYQLDKYGNSEGYRTYRYNDKGLNVDTRHYKLPSGELEYFHKQIYEYNIFGDWINQVFIRDDEPQYIYERIIDYY